MNKVHFSSKNMNWETPTDLFNKLDKHFKFKYDLASDKFNHKCDKYFTKEDNSLSINWDNLEGWCWLNPPYGRDIKKWVKKASESKAKIVMLIPARTDTKYWHDYIFGKASIYFIKGRLKFELKGVSGDSAPFPSALIIFDRKNKKVVKGISIQ